MDTNAFISQAISVRLLRIKKKQYQLAAELNIDQTVLSHYMTGKSSWNAKVMDRIAPLLGWGSAVDIAIAAEEERQIMRSIPPSESPKPEAEQRLSESPVLEVTA